MANKIRCKRCEREKDIYANNLCLSCYMYLRVINNKELYKKQKEHCEKWRKKNPKYFIKWRKNHKNYWKEYYQKNKEKILKKQKEYKKQGLKDG